MASFSVMKRGSQFGEEMKMSQKNGFDGGIPDFPVSVRLSFDWPVEKMVCLSRFLPDQNPDSDVNLIVDTPDSDIDRNPPW